MRPFLIKLLIFIAAAALSVRSVSYAAEKRHAPYDLDFDIYQLGDSEIVISFNGKNLPEPDFILSDDKAQFKFINFSFKTPPKNNDFTNKNYIDAVPLVSNFDTEYLSGDLIIKLNTTRPMQLHSNYKNLSEKYTFRLAVKEDEKNKIQAIKPINHKYNLSVLFDNKNEKITLELRDANLREVFEMFAKYINKSVIIDKSFPVENVTLTFNNETVHDAVQNLMTAYDVSYRLLNKNTVVFGSEEGLARFSGREKLGRIKTSYAEPNLLRDIIIKLVKLPDDKITVDTRMRALYIKSNPEQLEQAYKLIKSLDSPGRQVKIHARIFEFTSSHSREIETALDAVYSHWRFNYSGNTGLFGEYIDRNPATLINGVLREFDASFRAIESKGFGKTVASPSVTAIDGQEARISLTEEYPYISERDEAGNSEWSTQTVGPQLFITPKIGREGLINMKIDISTGDVIDMITGSTGEQMPRTSKRSVTTNALVRDGEPFVIGGLFRDSTVTRRSGIPVFGDIPVIGNLFKYSYKDRNRTQAVILVVSYIIETPDSEVELEIIE